MKANAITHDATYVAGQVFDYIVVGGGTTGLTVASRLSEDPNISVLVIECGFWENDRGAEVADLTLYGRQFGTAMDHVFTTRPQTVDNRSHHINSGRGLGGSTLINGGAWTRPARVQVDAWQDVFGNNGWTWDELLPHLERIETVRSPSPGSGQPFEKAYHGDSGSVQVGPFDVRGDPSPLIQAFKDVARKRNMPIDNDLSSGNPHGVSQFPVTITPSGQRCHAATSWLSPILNRPNLKVLVGQYVGKVLLDTCSDVPKATGVEYGRYREKVHQVYAGVEVIIAAGALVSPLILEYSGIGLSHVLAKAGIDQVVDLPVGVNHQDQTNTNVVNLPTQEGLGQGQAACFASFEETLGDQAFKAREMLQDDTLLQQYADEVVARGGFHDASLLMTQYKNHRDHILNQNVACSELLLDTWGEFGFSIWNLLPFGRGYIHVQSSDPYLLDYEYDPQFLSTELDILVQASASRLARDMSSKSPMVDFRQCEMRPGLDEVNAGADISSWIRWVKSNYRANLHAVGTCSMMRQDIGGVVNSRAQIYGVHGLRVVDASIIPTQVSSHMMALLYGMADKIADYIQEDRVKSSTHPTNGIASSKNKP